MPMKHTPAETTGEPVPRPWWYRIPPAAVVLITYAATACLLLTVSESAIVWAGGGLLLGLLGTFVQGAARARHDKLHGA